MKTAYDIILKPAITEQSMEAVEEKKYVFYVLVLTSARERFGFAPIGESGGVLPVCSGDMLFNVFDEYMGFLQ